jgi:hypothetical protein
LVYQEEVWFYSSMGADRAQSDETLNRYWFNIKNRLKNSLKYEILFTVFYAPSLPLSAS